MITTYVVNYSFDELEPEISYVKGNPGIQTGGTPSSQSGGHLSLGRECFTPLHQNCFEEFDFLTFSDFTNIIPNPKHL